MQSQEEVRVDLRELRVVAKRAARTIVRFSDEGLDLLAHDRDDYESQLLVSAWEAQKKFRCDQRTGRNEDELRYCCAAVWNAARDFHQDRFLEEKNAPFRRLTIQADEIEVDSGIDIEARYSAAETLALLQETFSTEDWGLLERLAQSGGEARDAYVSREADGSLSSFFGRASKLRKRAQCLLLRDGE